MFFSFFNNSKSLETSIWFSMETKTEPLTSTFFRTSDVLQTVLSYVSCYPNSRVVLFRRFCFCSCFNSWLALDSVQLCFSPRNREMQADLRKEISTSEISHLRRRRLELLVWFFFFKQSPYFYLQLSVFSCPNFSFEAVSLCGFAVLIFSEASGPKWNPRIKEPREGVGWHLLFSLLWGGVCF